MPSVQDIFMDAKKQQEEYQKKELQILNEVAAEENRKQKQSSDDMAKIEVVNGIIKLCIYGGIFLVLFVIMIISGLGIFIVPMLLFALILKAVL